MYFPYHVLGYACNPFRALTDEEWSEIAVLPEAVTQIIEGSNAHLQVMGKMGCGKTTVLLGLAAHLGRAGRRVGYEYVAEGESRFQTPVNDLDVFLLDEAQRLSFRQRQRLLRVARGTRLVLGSHADWTALFTRLGTTLATIRLDETPPAYFRAALERRLDYFALPNVPCRATLSPGAIVALHEVTGGNLRAAGHLLYEIFHRLTEPIEITAAQVWAAQGS